MTKKPSRSMQKFLERRKKENEENAIDYILLSENEEFKQAFVIIDRRNTGREIKLLEHKNRNTHTDIQNFIYDFLENNIFESLFWTRFFIVFVALTIFYWILKWVVKGFKKNK